MIPYRWTVACINWTKPGLPHAVAYLRHGRRGEFHRYFDTHAEAIAWADAQARRRPTIWAALAGVR